MTTDRGWKVEDESVDFDSIFTDSVAHVRDDDEVDLIADEDPEWRAWRETMTN